MRRGPKGTPPALKKLAGTERPSRVVIEAFPSAPGAQYAEPDLPVGMTRGGKESWARKIERYRERGQVVRGCEDTLRQYCELEAEIEKRRKKGVEIPVAMIREHRTYAAEFYDTPAARKISAADPKRAVNPFLKNLHRNVGA